jgi:aryl sulfotransferase
MADLGRSWGTSPHREYRNHTLDSTRWTGFVHRPGDINITTPYKSGTTWMQQIVASLVWWPQSLTVSLDEVSPWLDARFHGPIESILQDLEAQQHRRFLKSHLAADGLPLWEDVSYIVVGRDPRDVFMSLWNHYSGHTDRFFEFINDPGRPGDPFPRPPDDPRTLWRQWATRGWFPWESDGWPYWSHSHHWAIWWEHRRRPNVMFVHYADLLEDLPGEINRVADFLGITVDGEAMPHLVQAATFESMKAEARRHEAADEDGGWMWRDGTATFFFRGTNGRWRSVTDGNLVHYETGAAKLDPSLRAWLETGRTGSRVSLETT